MGILYTHVHLLFILTWRLHGHFCKECIYGTPNSGIRLGNESAIVLYGTDIGGGGGGGETEREWGGGGEKEEFIIVIVSITT